MRVNAIVAALHPRNQGFRWEPIRGPFRAITEEQARSYNERGFFLLEDALDRETVARVTAAIDPFEARGEEALRSLPGKRMFIAEADGITFTTHLVKLSPVLARILGRAVFS